MNWQALAGQLANMGLPILGKIIGGQLIGSIPVLGPILGTHGAAIGENIGTQVAAAIAIALGIPVAKATPEAISKAIEGSPTSDVMAKLKAVEAEAAARWPALARMEEETLKTEVALATADSDNYINRIRAESAIAVATNDYWPTFYRTLMNWGAMFNIMIASVVIWYSLIADDSMWGRLVSGQTLLAWWFGGVVLIILGHYTTRAAERRKAMDVESETSASASTTTITTKKG